MDHAVLMEMEKALKENKTLKMLTLSEFGEVTLPKEFCRHVLLGSRRNSSLSVVNLDFIPLNWDCPDDGRLVCQSHIV